MVLLITVNITVASTGLTWVQNFTRKGFQHITEYTFLLKKYSLQIYENKWEREDISEGSPWM